MLVGALGAVSERLAGAIEDTAVVRAARAGSLLVWVALFAGCNTPASDVTGRLPSEDEAVAIQSIVSGFFDICGEPGAPVPDLPRDIAELEPLAVLVKPNGVLLVFERRFVEVRGYFFSADGLPIEGFEQGFCSEISPGVFSFYDPG